ncbi:MAG: hypothetical protein ONB51_13365 [candidate division KSB1 bacterium]|nr:hypothetical protein [candidate division KSB1 bacterium]MDZ7410208.1 hypothetical protein [candidate division KSB1 bacterium]
MALLAGGLLLGSRGYGQDWPDAATPTQPDSAGTQFPRLAPTTTRPFTTLTQFGHDIEIYTWQAQLNFQKTLASRWQLTLFEHFNSTLQQQGRGDIWKDDQFAGVRLSRLLLPVWRLEVETDSRVFRDDFTNRAATSRNNDFSLHRLTVRHEVTLAQRLRLTPGVGYRWEDLLNRREYGPHVEARISLAPVAWDEYVHQFEAGGQRADTPDRRNEDGHLTYSVSRQFEGQAADSLFVRFSHLRRENYFADTTLQVDGLDRNRRSLENRLQYRFASGLLQLRTELSETELTGTRRRVTPVTLAGRLSGRFHERNFESSHQGLLLWQGDGFASELTFAYASRNRTFAIPDSLRASPFLRRFPRQGFDAEDWDLALGHRLLWRLSRRDSLRWSGRATRTAHNTANLENPDDYDRVQVQANVLYERRLHAGLRLRWELRSYLEHQVYLKRNLSADNRWIRILQLLPQLVITPGEGMTLHQGFGVRATYIDYDFPETVARRRSLVFRDFVITDSLTARLTRATQLGLQYKFTLEERGMLDWERWLQTPQTSLHRHFALLTFRHELAPGFVFTPSASYYREDAWTFRRRRPGSGYQQQFSHAQVIVTPGVVISYWRPPHTLLLLTARRQISRRLRASQPPAPDQHIDTFNLTLQWAL